MSKSPVVPGLQGPREVTVRTSLGQFSARSRTRCQGSDRHSGIQGSGKGAPKRGYCAFRCTPFRRLSRPWRAWRDWIDPKMRWQGQNWYTARMPNRYKASSWHDRLVLMQKELKSSGSETLFWVCCTPNSHKCAGAPTRKIARGSSAASRSMRWACYSCSRRT